MILREPYSSKNLKLLNMKNVVGEVNRYIAIDYAYMSSNDHTGLKPFEGFDVELKPVILYGMTDSEKEVTPLSHPFFSYENKWVALDLRNHVRVTGKGEGYEIRNESEYRLALIKYVLSGLWGVGKQSTMYSLELAHFSFATWLSDNLTSKFGLSLGDQVRLRTLASLYYARLFYNDIPDDELDKLLIRTKKNILVPELVKEIHATVGDMQTIDDFCKMCYEVTGNLRLKGLDYVVLSNIISGNWLGASGKELSLLALEHPPTWIAMVYAAITQRAFKRSFITSIVEKQGTRGKDGDFVKQVESMTKAQFKE